MEKGQLFLIGSGRSGTTLIQRIVNTFPNTMIWGEHGGFLTKIADAYFFLKENASMHEFSYDQKIDLSSKYDLSSYNDCRIWQAWINWFRPDDIDEMFRKIVENFFCPKEFEGLELWGFKEIRYSGRDKVIPFLTSIYPNAVFLFITRSSLNTLESQVTTFHKGNSKFLKLKRFFWLPKIIGLAREWTLQNQSYLDYSKADPARYRLIRYEDVLDNLSILDSVLSDFGLSIGVEQEQVLSMSEGRGTNFNFNNSVHSRWKRMGYIPAFFCEVIMGKTSANLGYVSPSQLLLATRISSWIF